MRHRLLPILGILGVALSVWACASTPEEPLVDKLRRVADQTPGFGPGASVLALDATDERASWRKVAKARGEGPSVDARVLAQAITKAASVRVRIVVGGPYGGLTRQVVLDAFDLVPVPALPRLTLLFVGPERAARDPRLIAESMGATFLQTEFPQPPPEDSDD